MRTLLLYVILVSVSAPELSSVNWSLRAPIPTKRWCPGSVVCDEIIYVIGGQDESSTSTGVVEAYDPVADSWVVKADLPTPRWGLMTAEVNGKIYAIGGQAGTPASYTSVDVVEEYDPAEDTWITKNSMPTARGWGGCGVIGDRIYVIGGYSSILDLCLKIVEVYDVSGDSWYTVDSMPYPRDCFMTAQDGPKIYIISGCLDVYLTDSVLEYDPLNQLFTTKAPIITPRVFGTASGQDGKIYVLGGRQGNSNEFEVYDINSNVWYSLDPMPTTREGLIAEYIAGKIFAIAGSSPTGFPFYDNNEVAEDLTGVEETGNNHNSKFSSFIYPVVSSEGVCINYSVPHLSYVQISIFDLLGNCIFRINEGMKSEGNYQMYWDGSDYQGNYIGTGIYIYKIKSDHIIETGKIVLID